MTNNNHQTNSSCAFAEILIAALYNEATAIEKQQLEIHLGGCQSCREEYVSLGEARTAVADWRRIVFDPLENPSIILPTPQLTAARHSQKISWLEWLRELMQPSDGGHWQGATALAAVAICVALLAIFGYALINNRTDNNLVAEMPKIEKTKVARTAPTENSPIPPVSKPETTALDELQQTSKNSAPGENAKPKNAPITPKSQVTVVKSAPPRSGKTTAQPPVAAAGAAPLPPKAADVTVEQIDDLEDNSLRLSDLLDDVTPSM